MGIGRIHIHGEGADEVAFAVHMPTCVPEGENGLVISKPDGKYAEAWVDCGETYGKPWCAGCPDTAVLWTINPEGDCEAAGHRFFITGEYNADQVSRNGTFSRSRKLAAQIVEKNDLIYGKYSYFRCCRSKTGARNWYQVTAKGRWYKLCKGAVIDMIMHPVEGVLAQPA